MHGIDLNDVAAFVRVAEDGGFTTAARALGVPKSTVSRALARLERALETRLVHRTTRSVSLTDAGRDYYARVRGPVAQVAEATSAATDQQSGELRGTIRITSPVDLGDILLAEIIVAFVQKHPQVRFDVSLTSRVVDLVAEGFDLAVRASPMPDSSLVVRKLGPSHMGLFASPKYLARRGTPTTVAELAGHDFVGFRALATRGTLTIVGPDGEEELHLPAVSSIVADDLLFLNRAVAAGAGLGLLPLFFGPCEEHAKRVGLMRVMPEWYVRGGPIHVVAPGGPHEPRRVRLFRDFLLSEAKKRGFSR